MKKRLPLFLVFFASFGILAFSFYQNSTFVSSLPKIEPIELDYSWQVSKSTSWQVNKQQTEQKQTLIYARMVNYDNQTKRSTFVEPAIIEASASEILFVNSQRGSTSNDQVIELRNQVIIHSFDMAAEENKTLRTEQITYNTETETATSQVFTELYKPGFRISGTGFEANLKQEKYTFKSDVKTFYQPEP